MTFWLSEFKGFWQNSDNYWIQGLFELIVVKVEQAEISAGTF